MSNYTIELNNERRDADLVSGKFNAKSPVVEVFSAMVNGKELSRFGKVADKAVDYIKELNFKASAGDAVAASELNELRRYTVEPLLMKEMRLMSIYGNYSEIGFNESCEVDVPDFANLPADIQAPGQDVTTPILRKKRMPISTVTISGGYAVDYRKAELGDMSEENEMLEQVRVQIRNKATKYVAETIYNAVKNAKGVKYYFSDAGLTKTNVDALIAKVRRFGKVTISGDYALLSEFNGFAGYQGVTPTVNGISDAIMNEIHETGLMGMYNGAILAEIQNPYDFSTLNKDGDNFETIMPAGLGFVIPTGVQSPIYSVTRGGLTSLTGTDIATGQVLTRMDLQVGAIVAPGREFMIGLIHDQNLDTLDN